MTKQETTKQETSSKPQPTCNKGRGRLGLVGVSLAALLFSTACDVDADEGEDIDQQQLASYKRALPKRAQLEASRTQASTMNALGDPAVYPHSSAPVVEGINGAVTQTTDMLEFVTSLPPSYYDSSTLEFVWGPYAADDHGYVAAYIKDTGGAGDFRFEYAFLRGATNEIDELTPVIYGGATPDESAEDRGVGVTVWDLTAADSVNQVSDPNYDASKAGLGRFAALFGAGPDEDNPDNEVAFVVAVFRDFVAEDSEDRVPTDLDYLYGHVDGAEMQVDFVDFTLDLDVSEPLDGVRENLAVRMAFIDEGIGRAEASAAGGSLTDGQRYEVEECWDTSLSQTYISGSVVEGGSATETHALGESSDCGVFDLSLNETGIPTLADIDPALLAALDSAASNGL